jgi:[ribosomal protein S18]-alanine N-acetyltransferase
MTKVRPLAGTELTILASLHAACFIDAWSEATLAELLASPGVFAFMAEGAEGFVIARAAAGEAEILSIGTVPAHRRQGIGRRLLSAAAVEARHRGAMRLVLEVAADNDAALALYRRAGFGKVGRRAAYYRRPTGAVAAEVLAIDLAQDGTVKSLGESLGESLAESLGRSIRGREVQ